MSSGGQEAFAETRLTGDMNVCTDDEFSTFLKASNPPFLDKFYVEVTIYIYR